jgi:hypothetical protein
MEKAGRARRVVKIRVPDELYLELVRRFGARGISEGVVRILLKELGLEAPEAKAQEALAAKASGATGAKDLGLKASEALGAEDLGSTGAASPAPPSLSVGEVAALLGDVESVALVSGVPVSFGSEAERRGFIAYQLAAPRPDESAWIVVRGVFADYVLFTWTAGRKVSKEEVLEAAKRFAKRGLRGDARKLVAEGEDEAALVALFVLTEKGMVDWSSGAPAPVIR